MRMEQKAKKTTQKINETKSWFFQNINKIAKHLNRWIRKKRKLNLLISKTKDVT